MLVVKLKFFCLVFGGVGGFGDDVDIIEVCIVIEVLIV